MLAATLTRIWEPYTAGCTPVILSYLSFFEEAHCQTIETMWKPWKRSIRSLSPTIHLLLTLPLNHVPKYHIHMFPSFAGGSEQSTFQRNSNRIHVSLNQSKKGDWFCKVLCLQLILQGRLALVILNQKQDPQAQWECGSLPALFDSYLPFLPHIWILFLPPPPDTYSWCAGFASHRNLMHYSIKG